ncbi:bacitracin transport system permease protein [Seinonella peptonophila]|uniref:Bacitracin transport system permease protein n=1 Tax=Seinonella peptonophila TaxID=112248 RepID=A0A1M4WDU2_9BACL|nr:ABC transporter permease [Seinonella peptonophila]SHE79451.1 bacitracin transport system permease protein [Seinonella peptonophila]
MITTIRLELLKWKRSKIILSAIIATLMTPLITLLSTFMKTTNLGVSAKWVDLVGLAFQVNHLFIFPLLFGSLTAFIFVHEFQTKSIINLYTLPKSRTTILLAKTIVIFLMIIILTILSHILIILTGTLFIQSGAWNAFLYYFPLALKTGLMQFLMIPIYICISLWTQHFIPPIVTAGLFIMTAFISLAMPSIGPLLFPALPYYVILQSIGWYNQTIPLIWDMLIPIFLITMVIAMMITEKRDIH